MGHAELSPVTSGAKRRGSDSRAQLYGIKHSHAVLASRMALELSGLEFDSRDLFSGLHGLIVRANGFPGWTVPALEIGGRKVQGTLAIAREVDRLVPDTGLFPRDPRCRQAVAAAERFGHDELQPVARRVLRWAGANDNAVRAWMARHVMSTPAPTLAGYAFKPAMILFARLISNADDTQVRRDLSRLPSLLDYADTLIEAGTIGGEAPNAADLQILRSLRLLIAHEDLRVRIEPRPCSEAALRLIPGYPRSGAEALPPVPAVLPPQWLAKLGASIKPRAAPAPPIGSMQPAAEECPAINEQAAAPPARCARRAGRLHLSTTRREQRR